MEPGAEGKKNSELKGWTFRKRIPFYRGVLYSPVGAKGRTQATNWASRKLVRKKKKSHSSKGEKKKSYERAESRLGRGGLFRRHLGSKETAFPKVLRKKKRGKGSPERRKDLSRFSGIQNLNLGSSSE